MLGIFVNVMATLAIFAGVAVILGKTMPRMPNKVCRFIFLFVLGVPLNCVMNYVDIRTMGYHKMGWVALLIIALLFATGATFWPPLMAGD